MKIKTIEKERPSFESCLPQIDELIKQRKSKWTLHGLAWIDFNDISQILRLHIWEKWDLYDPNRPLPQWINRIITNQLINLRRNLYYSYVRPCLRCADNEGGDLCRQFEKQSNKCPLYLKWEQTKKRAHDLKLALTIENHTQEIFDIPDGNCDYEKAEQRLHEEMKKNLKPHEYRVYEMLFIFHFSDIEVAKKMGYKTTEKHRKPGYNTLTKLKKLFLKKAYKIKQEIDLF